MVLLMAGKSLWSFWNTALSLTINVVLNLWLIPQIGINGAALAWAISRVVGNVLPLIQLRSAFHLHPFGARWTLAGGLSLAIFGGGGLVVRLLVGDGLMPAIIFGLLATVGYGLLLFRWRDRLDLTTAVAGFRRRLEKRPV
jgi:O-antigen/teichoic acid export membrane protein